MEHLERDRPVVPQVLSEENRRHAAAPELTLEGIGSSQGRLQLGAQVRQTARLLKGQRNVPGWLGVSHRGSNSKRESGDGRWEMGDGRTGRSCHCEEAKRPKQSHPVHLAECVVAGMAGDDG